jgi:hypothetical protein
VVLLAESRENHVLLNARHCFHGMGLPSLLEFPAWKATAQIALCPVFKAVHRSFRPSWSQGKNKKIGRRNRSACQKRAVPFCLSLISAAFQGLVDIRLAKKSVAPRLDPWSRIVPYYS